MAQRGQQRGEKSRDDDPIQFEDLQGNPEDDVEIDWGDEPDTPGVEERGAPTDDSDGRRSTLTAQDENEDDDAGWDDEDEPEEEAGETEEEVHTSDLDDVDEDLRDLPPKAARRAQAERDRAREYEQEIGNYRRREYDQALQSAKANVQHFNSQLDQKRAAYRQAIEEGDTDQQTKLMEEIADLKSYQREWSNYQQRLEQSGGPDTTAAPKDQGPTPEAKRWLERNTWFKEEGNQQAKQAAAVIDRNLAAEGYDTNSPEYFDEMNRRLRNKFPNLPVKASRDRGNGRKRDASKRSPVGAPDKGAQSRQQGRGRTSSRRVTLTKDDRENMMTFGLDPRNPEHAKMYAREKQNSERAERDRRQR